ncbi:hypothetical protein M758_12G115300 [Ceratodon purpureus]|uniref:Uncharacterized protein n=1 Tax=Ceratodon purpureus TaxID=3225 RepID=A0A8T0G6Z8_CERPU|nr:hypothetical protein KC19_12G111900 [Ceratodon purpureus]KAG0598959.1 hypothetical protein M758_12G115300 [Ceratodon purpureus]
MGLSLAMALTYDFTSQPLQSLSKRAWVTQRSKKRSIRSHQSHPTRFASPDRHRLLSPQPTKLPRSREQYDRKTKRVRAQHAELGITRVTLPLRSHPFMQTLSAPAENHNLTTSSKTTNATEPRTQLKKLSNSLTSTLELHFEAANPTIERIHITQHPLEKLQTEQVKPMISEL